MLRHKERYIAIDSVSRGIVDIIKIDRIIIQTNISMKGVAKSKEKMTITDYRNTRMWGQKTKRMVANRAVADFNIKVGSEIGTFLTIRDHKMLDALYKMIVLIQNPREQVQSAETTATNRTIVVSRGEGYGMITDWTFAHILETVSPAMSDKVRELKLAKEGLRWEVQITPSTDIAYVGSYLKLA